MQNQRYNRPDTHVFFFLRVFWVAFFDMGNRRSRHKIRPFGKGRTHLIGTSLHRNHYSPFVAFACLLRRIQPLHSVDRSPPFSAMPDVGTYRQVRPLPGYPHLPNQNAAARIPRLPLPSRFFGIFRYGNRRSWY